MGMTAIEKALARRCGRAQLRPGEIVHPDPDFVMIHDQVVIGAKRELDALGIDRLAAPEKVVIVTDHEVIYASARGAERGVANRRAAAQWGVVIEYPLLRLQKRLDVVVIAGSTIAVIEFKVDGDGKGGGDAADLCQ